VIEAIRQHPDFTARGDSLCGGASVNWKSSCRQQDLEDCYVSCPARADWGRAGRCLPPDPEQPSPRSIRRPACCVHRTALGSYSRPRARLGSAALCAIQSYETIEPESLVELQERFEWSVLRIYNLNAPGDRENAGVERRSEEARLTQSLDRFSGRAVLELRTTNVPAVL
jgi:hypothetical protein